MGSLRSSAQLISYERCLGLAVVGGDWSDGSLRLDQVVHHQPSYLFGVLPARNCFIQPIGFITFVVWQCLPRQTDCRSTCQTQNPGFWVDSTPNTPVSSSACLPLQNTLHIIVASAIVTTVYLGGWHVPSLEFLNLSSTAVSIIAIVAFATQVTLVLLSMIVIRWTIPRFRYDPLMGVGWKAMFPRTLLNILITRLILLLF